MAEVPPPASAPPPAVSTLALVPSPTPPSGPLNYRERLAQFRILEEKRIELIEVFAYARYLQQQLRHSRNCLTSLRRLKHDLHRPN
jgi:hypothetical protein